MKLMSDNFGPAYKICFSKYCCNTNVSFAEARQFSCLNCKCEVYQLGSRCTSVGKAVHLEGILRRSVCISPTHFVVMTEVPKRNSTVRYIFGLKFIFGEYFLMYTNIKQS